MVSLVRSLLHIGNDNSIDHNPLTMSDEHILEEIYVTHVHSDTKFDAESLFNIAGNILTRSTHVVDNVLQVCKYICTLIIFFFILIMHFDFSYFANF